MTNKEDEKILDYISAKKECSIDELSNVFSVSPSTIRRELNKLQEKDLIKRTHGGVILSDRNTQMPSFTFRSHQNSFEKKKMALEGVKLIHDGDLVFLDGSSSSFYVASYIEENRNIKVITNGIDTLSLLSKKKIDVYSTGGSVSADNRSALVGSMAENFIDNFHADICFFSAQSIDRNGIIYDCFEKENSLRKTMMKNSEKNVLLVDSTKLNRTSQFKLCSSNDVSYIICDIDCSNVINIGKSTILF